MLRFIEHFEDDHHHYLALELLSGGELTAQIVANRGLPERTVRFLLLQIAVSLNVRTFDSFSFA